MDILGSHRSKDYFKILGCFLKKQNNFTVIVASIHLDFNDDRVEGIRMCLWTAATNGPIVHPPSWYMSMENHDGMLSAGESPDSSSRALWQSYQQNHLVAKQEYTWQRKWWIWPSTHLCSYFEVIFTCRIILRHRADGFVPLWRKACYGFLLPLKIYLLYRFWTLEPWMQWQAR
jgi:hypothetical protein